MDKTFRKNMVWPVMLLAAGLMSGGCGKAEPFDASGYVESVLDANYHGEYEEYAGYRDISVEDAKEEIEESVDAQVEAELSDIDGMTEEGKDEYRALLAEMDKLMRYEVGQAEENKDESYQVPVTIEPVNIYQTLEQHSSDVTQEMLSQGEDPSTAEGFTRVLTESMRRAIDGVSYAEEETVEITVKNRFITGAVQTTKVDAEYPDNKLTGAVFEVYIDADGNQEFDPDIDRPVGEMNEIEDGVYRMDGLRYNGYFLYEKSSPEGFLKDENYHYFEIRNDGETVIVENEAGVGFVNQPITGELEITKKDISDGKLLSGVGFRIKNDKGEIVAEGYTDENGIAEFTLRYGKYTYQEFDPLDGYQPDETEYPFEIKEDGEIIKAEMTNEKIPTPDIPQTGDDTNLGFFIGLGAIALGGLVASVIMYIKRKKDDDNE